MNVLIPMAGLGSRFTKYGFATNKYLLPIDIQQTKMIEKAILTLNIPSNSQFIFILREEKEKDDSLRLYLHELCDKHSYKCIILSVNYLTEGPASTAYIAKDYINNDIPLIISNSDQILDWNYNSFINKCNNYDGCVLTYKPNYELIIGTTDKHSFVRFDDNTEKPVEFIEKTVISNEALVGVHYYKKGSYFIESTEYIFSNNIRAPNGEFYLSYTYQALLNMNYSIGSYCLSDNEFFYPVGEPEDYFHYYNSTSKLITSHISNYNIINNENNNNFYISEGLKDNIIKLSNSLFIPFNDSHTICYLTGENMNYKFEKNIYYLIVNNINYTNGIQIDLSNYVRGWLIGDFEPSIKKTTEFEIGFEYYKKDQKCAFHYHSETKEINILISGVMIINNIPIYKDTIFILEKNMICCPLFIQNCIILSIKLPSLPKDKFII
jgi:dTDP-glucose pyrophosphorylase